MFHLNAGGELVSFELGGERMLATGHLNIVDDGIESVLHACGVLSAEDVASGERLFATVRVDGVEDELGTDLSASGVLMSQNGLGERTTVIGHVEGMIVGEDCSALGNLAIVKDLGTSGLATVTTVEFAVEYGDEELLIEADVAVDLVDLAPRSLDASSGPGDVAVFAFPGFFRLRAHDHFQSDD